MRDRLGRSPTATETKLVFPIIANGGGVEPLPNAAEPPRKGAKVVFDINRR